MFFDGKKEVSVPELPDANRPAYKKKVQHSIIGADVTITGDLVSSGDIKVDGRVDGNITCRTLTLGNQPVVNSSIKADTVRICGTFNGEVKAAKVVLTKDARVSGDIMQEILEIEPGAILEGNISRLQPDQAGGQVNSQPGGQVSSQPGG
ncbi:MAG: polymer-forming cytoskeletal protein [Rhodospirillales bacterium]|nr:polymer-forming cytoskeletal protein [Rhodospirillales bacterium]